MSLTTKMLTVQHRALKLGTPQTKEMLLGQGVLNRELNALCRYRLMRSFKALVFEPEEIIAPLGSWNPGEPKRELAAIVSALDHRRRGQIARETRLFVATRRAANIFGEGDGFDTVCPFQLSHAVGVSAMILAWMAGNPGDLVVGESTLRAARDGQGRARGKFAGYLPDAAVIHPGGGIKIALDYGGQYGLQRLESLHNACSEAGVGWRIF